MAEYGLKHSLAVAAKRANRGEKFVTLLLLFIILTAATAGVTAVLTGPDWESLWLSLLFGLILGWLLAIFRWSAWRSALLVIALGLVFSLLYAGGLNEKVMAVPTEIFRLIGNFFTSLKIKEIDLVPLSIAFQQVLTSTGVVFGRVVTLIRDLTTGQPSFDPVAAGLVWGFMVWLMAAWAGWVVEATGNAILAVLPALLLNLFTLSYGRFYSASIYLILGVTLVLIAVVQYDRREQGWNETRVAYPTRKSKEIGSISLVITIILVVLSAIISSLSLQKLINWSSEIRRSTSQGESGLAKSLGIMPAVTFTPDPLSTIRSPGLPRELLIGGSPELSTQVVMSVRIADMSALPPAGQMPPLYWRSFTYDIYTGYGWSSSATDQTQYQADQPIQPDQLPGHVLIEEQVSAVPGEGGSIFAAGEPVNIDAPSSAAWRSSNDLFGILTGSNVYAVQSLVPAVDETSLRASSQAYPAWVTRRYLTLPAEVPTRVKELAIQLTATEPTPYDRAHAIEQYLRTFPYTLDVPRPPLNQDLVDYFLFNLQKGYCDYYASAMVVLARAAGLPARLAIGYASGTYNINSRRFVVTQAEAHSWVEVFFPDTGWVPFEPTAGLPAINRSGQSTLAATPVPITPVTPTKTTSAGSGIGKIGKYMGLILLFVVVISVIIWQIVNELNLRRLKPGIAAREVYRRMRQYGKLLRTPMDGGETPYEFATSASRRIAEITGSGRLTAVGFAAGEGTLAIIDRIVLLCYRPESIESSCSKGIIHQWSKLRWQLRLIWVLELWNSILQRLQGWSDGKAERRDNQAG